MKLSELIERFKDINYDIEIFTEGPQILYYLREFGTIMDCVNDEDLHNLEQLEEKLFQMEGE